VKSWKTRQGRKTIFIFIFPLQTICMANSAHTTWEKEVSALALFIAVPQAIASPIIVAIEHSLHPHNTFFDLKEILDFLLISFPLTLSIAILFVIIEKGEFSPGALLLIVGGAALLSNLLHGIVQQIPSVDVNKTFNETFTRTDIGGNSAVFIFVKKIFGIYWKNFGPLLFIQSCCIGLYAGYRYTRIRDKKETEKHKARP
jgi:hypothetical protein